MNEREIKFNVYNNSSWKIVKWDECEIRLLGYWIYRVYVNWLQVCNDKSSKLLSFTWLQDKNWVDIYEWDIVKFKTIWLSYIMEVKWKWDEHCWLRYIFECQNNWQNKCFPENTIIDFDMNKNEIDIEFIWNIYENPELLI